MEIIKHGNTIKEYKCECGCEFIAFKTDQEVDRDFFLHKIRYCVACPECGRVIKESYTNWED